MPFESFTLKVNAGYFANHHLLYRYERSEGLLTVQQCSPHPFYDASEPPQECALRAEEQEVLVGLIYVLLQEGKERLSLSEQIIDGPSYELLIYQKEGRVKGWSVYNEIPFLKQNLALKKLIELLRSKHSPLD